MTDEVLKLSLEALADEEAELKFERFDFDDAWRLGGMLVEAGRSRELPIAIDVSRGGQTLFHAALPGSTPDNDAWIERKIRSVLRFGKSSMRLSVERSLDGRSLAEVSFVDPREFAAAGGCFPIRIEGAGVIGTVTVSGLPQVEDHRLVVETIRQFLEGV